MARYKIVRTYVVPGRDMYQASDRMRRAIELRVENDFHVGDYIRLEGDKSGRGKRLNLEPPTSWLGLLIEQLVGR
jgi:hypothetical protein